MTFSSEAAIAEPGKPVIDPANWRGNDLASREDWLFHLQANEIADLLEMSGRIRKEIKDDPNRLLDLPAQAFDLGSFAGKLRRIQDELADGLGLTLLRGLPMDEMELIDAAVIYWAMGRHMGNAVSNNPDGDMLGHVTDLGKDYNDPAVRGYQTRALMDYHCDQCTIVGLLCVRSAMSGGVSSVASSVAVYNELLSRRPDLVDELMESLCWTQHGEVEEGGKGYYQSPVFNFLDGKICTSLGPMHIFKGHALPGAPDLTDIQREAIELAAEIAHDLRFEMKLAVGDIQFANNFVILHTRSEYQDWPEPERKRLLWRLWLFNEQVRPSTDYAKQWQSGVKQSNTSERIVLL